MKLIRSSLDLQSRVQVMGVLNVTPDSFSDGGKYSLVERACERALQIANEGADIIDVGGESTRPSAHPVSEADELARVGPVLDYLAGRLPIPISIDTTKAAVARYAIKAGAEMINDVGGLRFDPELAELSAQSGAALVLVHSRGVPRTMQQLPAVDNILGEVTRGLALSIEMALKRGVRREQLILDPGIGFGKTASQNLELINNLGMLTERFGLPVLVGPSRKAFIGRTLEAQQVKRGNRDEARDRVFGTAASVAMAVIRGARLVRVHDVAEMVTVVRMTEALIARPDGGEER